ncbi:trimeric LpxA-like protein [Naematelia encephala]|uniref:Trimeric LpxA-like protein n=1 Tax=Naematelia encephala TaxID=71784 RepID=A0A1Y2AI93_9TREE|nr:trimeric LpxA-like protein [Naematelia encephala]
MSEMKMDNSVQKNISREDQFALRKGRSEPECMVLGAGLPYRPNDDRTLVDGRLAVKAHMKAYNEFPWPQSPDSYFGPNARQALLGKVFGLTLEEIIGRPIEIEPPFWVDYGTRIEFAGSFYANTSLVILDAAKVKIGTRVLCGPRVGIYSASHSSQQSGFDRAYPVEIGDDCWLGAGCIINGPTKIGKGCTIAAGAVVRGTFPDHCVIGGVPARILKFLQPPQSL